MQYDGNLVLYDGSQALWHTYSWGRTGHGVYAVMQGDGNFVVYDPSTDPPEVIFNTRTWGNNGAYFVLQSNADMVVYHGIASLWRSFTQSCSSPQRISSFDGYTTGWDLGYAGASANLPARHSHFCTGGSAKPEKLYSAWVMTSGNRRDILHNWIDGFTQSGFLSSTTNTGSADTILMFAEQTACVPTCAFDLYLNPIGSLSEGTTYNYAALADWTSHTAKNYQGGYQVQESQWDPYLIWYGLHQEWYGEVDDLNSYQPGFAAVQPVYGASETTFTSMQQLQFLGNWTGSNFTVDSSHSSNNNSGSWGRSSLGSCSGYACFAIWSKL